jgi:large subunit ribosomal protein L9
MKVILNQDVKHLGEEGDVRTSPTATRGTICSPQPRRPHNEIRSRISRAAAPRSTRRRPRSAPTQPVSRRISRPDRDPRDAAGTNGKLYGAVTTRPSRTS